MKDVTNQGNRITVHGKTLSESVARDVLAEHGIKATKANIAKLVDHARDRDGNEYLKRGELEAGARKLAKELGGGTVVVKPDQPLSRVVNAVPPDLARYSISLVDTDGNKTLDMLHIRALPLQEQPARDPRVRAMGAGAPKAKKLEQEIGHDMWGNITLQFKNEAGEPQAYKNGTWLRKSFREMLAGRPNEKAELARLKASNYDLDAKRDLLAITVKGQDEPIIFGLRGPQDRKAKSDDANSRMAVRPGFMPGPNIDKRDYGFVSICSEVQVEQWGDQRIITVKKPVIYVYPEKKTQVRVTVTPNGAFSAQYPATKDGTWDMTALPDGTLFDPKSEKRYSYLFWEGLNPGHLQIDSARAFTVRSGEAELFLENMARKFALNDRERTDFVSYWIPALLRNPVSVVQFLEPNECAAYAKLSVEPKPDAEIRLFMIFRAAVKGEKTGNPVLPELRRGKFTVVEWGGANLDE